VLVQILLQSKGLKLNPITTLYYIAPACFVCLGVPWIFLELPKITTDTNITWDPTIFISNAGAAFGLNLGVFLLIGKTSALTMNIAGVVKDWMLIGLSYAIYKAPVTAMNLGGYFISFLAVGYYNYSKLQQKLDADAAAAKPDVEAAERPLLAHGEAKG